MTRYLDDIRAVKAVHAVDAKDSGLLMQRWIKRLLSYYESVNQKCNCRVIELRKYLAR